jgi:hypothetical protein
MLVRDINIIGMCIDRAETGDEGSELRSLEIEKRGGQCQFPSDAGLVAVTPGSSNAGWAMSPDQPCQPGHYCPYACPSGQMMAQWDPDATSYTYPQSMVLNCVPTPALPFVLIGSRMVGCLRQERKHSEAIPRQALLCQRYRIGRVQEQR